VPFKSQAQRGFMYAHHPKLAAEFEQATPKGKSLPQHVKKRKRTAPLPAAHVGNAVSSQAPGGGPLSVPAPALGKAMMQTIGQVSGLSRLRSMRLKTSGGFQP